MCREIDALIAFVPEASMGTAIEMWEAHQHGAAVLTISPLKHNWAVKFLSHAIYADEAEFVAALDSGELAADRRSAGEKEGIRDWGLGIRWRGLRNRSSPCRRPRHGEPVSDPESLVGLEPADVLPPGVHLLLGEAVLADDLGLHLASVLGTATRTFNRPLGS